MNALATFRSCFAGLSVSKCDANRSFLVLDFYFAFPRQPAHRHRDCRFRSLNAFFHRAQAGGAVGAQKMPYQTGSFTNRSNFRHRQIPPCRQFGIFARAWKHDQQKFLMKFFCRKQARQARRCHSNFMTPETGRSFFWTNCSRPGRPPCSRMVRWEIKFEIS